jgi:hypothetical protein
MQQAPKKIWSEFSLPQHIQQQKQKLYLSFKHSIPKKLKMQQQSKKERRTYPKSPKLIREITTPHERRKKKTIPHFPASPPPPPLLVLLQPEG